MLGVVRRLLPKEVRLVVAEQGLGEPIGLIREGLVGHEGSALGYQAFAARDEPVFEESVGDDSRLAGRCLTELPHEPREVIVLRIWGQLKLAEIAAVTGLSVSSVFYHYQQGLREIRGRMGVACPNQD